VAIEFSIVIPVFNEQDSLLLLQQELNKVTERFENGYEIIYVNDASTDSSLEVLERLKKKDTNVKIFSFKENKGQSQALLAGFNQSKGKWIITLDADLQNPPQEIPKLLASRDNFDLISGIRLKRKDSALKIISSAIARFFRWVVLGDVTKDIGCSLRVFRREAIGCLSCVSNFDLFFTYIVRESGFLVKEVGVVHQPRKFGKSKYSIFKKIRQGILGLWSVVRLRKSFLGLSKAKGLRAVILDHSKFV